MSKQKKYHYIYKTTCEITGKFYVGMHSTDNSEDGYLGSGKILGYSRNKYGDENHLKEILEHCSSRDELKKREKEIVNDELLANPLNINLKYGGEGGGFISWLDLPKEQRIALSIKGGKAAMAKRSVKDRKRISLKSAQTKKDRNVPGAFTGKKHSDIAIQKLKKTFKERGHMQGEKNSQYGIKRIGINKDGQIKKVLPEQLQSYLNMGWSKGFKHRGVL